MLTVDQFEQNSKLGHTGANLLLFRDYRYAVIRNPSDIAAQGVDILFYEQTWFDLSGDFTPDRMSAYALTFYVPYLIESAVTFTS